MGYCGNWNLSACLKKLIAMSDDLSTAKYRLLFVEDEEVDRMALERWLSQTDGLKYDYKIAVSLSEAVSFIGNEDFDIIITDHNLGDGSSFDLIESVNDTPVIVITRVGDEETAVEAIKRGASDYLAKDLGFNFLKVLPVRIEAAIKQKLAQAEIAAQAKQIEKSHDDMLSILNQLRTITVMTDEKGCITFMSRSGNEVFGDNYYRLSGTHWKEAFPLVNEDAIKIGEMLGKEVHKRSKVQVEMRANDKHFWMDIEIMDDPKEIARKIFVIYDMSDVYDLRDQLKGKSNFHGMIGKSKEMISVFHQINEVAKVDWTVLIEGATGTGKELVARAIHDCSLRRDRPFIAVNCAGLTDSLLSSQLFGHKKGSFTGAMNDQIGVFEAANRGTLFLDEIGDVSHSVQTSLLRVLENREITRLGDSVPRKVDIRILAATHKNLNEDVNSGKFRTDLLYRLRIARITLPSLQDRREDIPVLANLFLSKCRVLTGKDVREISTGAMRELMDYNWPGNVRELKSAIEFAVIHSTKAVIRAEELPPEVLDKTLPVSVLNEQTQYEEYDEKKEILSVLRRCRGNRAAAARLLEMGRSTLYRRLEELGIDNKSQV